MKPLQIKGNKRDSEDEEGAGGQVRPSHDSERTRPCDGDFNLRLKSLIASRPSSSLFLPFHHHVPPLFSFVLLYDRHSIGARASFSLFLFSLPPGIFLFSSHFTCHIIYHVVLTIAAFTIGLLEHLEL